MDIKLEQLNAIMPLARDKATVYLDPLNEAINRFHIDTPLRAAAFLANLAEESLQLTHVEENLNYSAKGLLATFPRHFNVSTALQYERKPSLIANRVYANRYGNGNEASGDGWKFRGRGPIQITFHNNYKVCGDAIGVDLIENPDLLLIAKYGALSAAHFWFHADLNDEADAKDFRGIVKIINGPAMAGYDQRFKFYETALKVLLGESV